MDNKVEECPKCGNYVEGKVILSDDQKLTRTVASKSFSNFTAPIIGLLVGTFFVPPIGNIIGFILGVIVSMAFGDKVVNKVEKSLFKEYEYRFTCPKCGTSWSRIFSESTDTTPIDVLKREIQEYSSRLRFRAILECLHFIIWLSAAIFSFRYCYVNDFSTECGRKDTWFGEAIQYDYDFLWPFIGFVFLLSIGPTIYTFANIFDLFSKSKDIKDINPERWRYSSQRKNFKHGKL